MKYSLGLDIGTTSVGWAVVNEEKQRIEDLGVRIFERPEDPQSGESLAKPRRDARSARRRLKRRRERLDYLKRFFINHNFLGQDEITTLLDYSQNHTHQDPYMLRVKALNDKVPHDELFLALYHIAKRRGYKSNRKAVEENDKDNGRVLAAIKTNQPLLAKYDNSVAKTLLGDEKFSAHKRNKHDNYNNSFIRADFETEILQILKAQNWQESLIQELLYANPNAPETRGKSGLFYQRPFMNAELIRKMRGKCQFEDAPRAPKASYSFDLFRLAQNLAHLEYNNGEKLTPAEIKLCIDKFKTVREPSYTTIRTTLGYTKDDNFHFDYIRGKEKDGEKNKFGGLKFYFLVKTALKNFPEKFAEIEKDIELFDQIGEALSLNKDDESIRDAFAKLNLPTDIQDELMKINVSGFCHLSLAALRKLAPELLQGQTYDKAVETAYPGQFSERLSGDKNELPPLSEDQLHQLTNPVAKRAISETRKVINAVIKKHGAPFQIKIECATDLAKNFKDRKKIETQQKDNAEYNEKIKIKLEEIGITNPRGQQIVKYKLREMQDCKCMYCGAPLGLDVFADDKIAEIDHIIPFSICGNDGLQNKVLVCAKCNQEKRNRIPFEVWGDDAMRWQRIIELANNAKIPFQKRNRILCEKPPKEGWNERALNDTRYVTKFMSQYIKRNLKFSDESAGKQKVLAPTGFITSHLRKMYGIGGKDREANNCHHAVDACIVATTSQGQIQKISTWHKYQELGAKHQTITVENDDGTEFQITQGDFEAERQMLPPWEDFAKEVRIRTGESYDVNQIEKLADFRDKFRDFKSYDAEFLQTIHPLFVSRLPKRSLKGKAHEETIRSPKTKDGDQRLTRKNLDKKFIENYLKNPAKSWLENSVLPESDKVLYAQIKTLLDEKGEKAFDEPIYKNHKRVDKNGNPLSPVTTIKVYESKPVTSGVLLNHGTQFADNGKTICLNIYRRKGHDGKFKFFAAPLYIHSLNRKSLPILPTPTGRGKEEKADFDKIRNADGLVMATPENGFELVAQVFPNDYIRIRYADKVIEGYYVKYGVNGGTLSLVHHNQTSKGDLDMIHCSVGSAIDIELISISVLGDTYKFQ